jgi:hypothetical protein
MPQQTPTEEPRSGFQIDTASAVVFPRFRSITSMLIPASPHFLLGAITFSLYTSFAVKMGNGKTKSRDFFAKTEADVTEDEIRNFADISLNGRQVDKSLCNLDYMCITGCRWAGITFDLLFPQMDTGISLLARP